MPIAGGLYSAANSLARGLTGAAESIGHGLVTAGTNAINRTGEAVYDAGQAVDHWMHPPQAPVDTFAQRGYPAYMTGANPDTFNRTSYQSWLGNYDPHTLPKQLPTINAYRADPTNKYGGGDGTETLPTQFMDGGMFKAGSPAMLYSYARAYRQAANHYDMPQMTAQQLAALAIKEGRADFGASTYDINNPQSKAMYADLTKRGIGDLPASFATTIAEKAAVAKRLGIPFAEAWNGTGSNGASTGAQYAVGYQHSLKAAAHPKNKQLVDFIQSALDAGARDK
jgi:hypothetical protein